MQTQPTNVYIDVTEILLRLYVFLAQHLDRCLDEAAKQSFPEKDLQHHLSATKSAIMEMLAVNPVVKGKVEKECDRILSLGNSYLQGPKKATALAELQQERAVLQNKTIALSDLLAVFRAL